MNILPSKNEYHPTPPPKTHYLLFIFGVMVYISVTAFNLDDNDLTRFAVTAMFFFYCDRMHSFKSILLAGLCSSTFGIIIGFKSGEKLG